VRPGSVGFLAPPAGSFVTTKTPTATSIATQTPTVGTTPTHASSPPPTQGKITISSIISSPFDGLIVDGSNNVWVTEKFGSNKLGLIPPGTRPTPTPVATGTTTPSATVTVTGTPTG